MIIERLKDDNLGPWVDGVNDRWRIGFVAVYAKRLKKKRQRLSWDFPGSWTWDKVQTELYCKCKNRDMVRAYLHVILKPETESQRRQRQQLNEKLEKAESDEEKEAILSKA